MITDNRPTRVLVTGASGLLGYHARAALLAENCASDFAGRPRPFEVVELPRVSEATLPSWVQHAGSTDLILHLAGINRATPAELEFGNASIAANLVKALETSGSKGSRHICQYHTCRLRFTLWSRQTNCARVA